MSIFLLTFPFDVARGGFDDDALQDLQRSHRVLEMREHWFVLDDLPHVACLLTCEPRQPAARAALPVPARRKRDVTAGLDAAQREAFESLRAWRRERAFDEGVPPYVVLTNRQLVEIVRRRPASRAALREIEGLGEKKLARHGAALLVALHGEAAGADAERAEAAS